MKNNKLSPSIRVRGFVEAWTEFTWANVVNISTEMVNPTSGIYDEWWHVGPGNIESFTGEILNNIKKVKDENLISNKFVFQPGDVIYSKIRPQLAKYAFPNFQGLASADAYVLTTKDGLIPEFLYLILHTSKFYKYSTSVSMRTGMPKINREELNQYAFYIPSNEEQQKISELLKKINKTITFHQQELDALKKTKQGFLQKMFPEEEGSIPKVRLSKYSGQWTKEELGKLVNKIRSYPLSRDVETKSLSEYKYVHYGDIHKRVAKYIDDLSCLPNIKDGNYERLEEGDLILADASEDYQGIANAAILAIKPMQKVIAGLHTIALRPNPEKLNSLYLYYLLESSLFKKFGYKIGTGMKVFGISTTNLLKFNAIFPTIEEQSEIGDFFRQLDVVIELKEQELEALKQTKQGFLQKMFV